MPAICYEYNYLLYTLFICPYPTSATYDQNAIPELAWIPISGRKAGRVGALPKARIIHLPFYCSLTGTLGIHNGLLQ